MDAQRLAGLPLGSPLLYEINTRCWLWELSETQGVPITLANIPGAELTRWRDLGFTHIWLMGVWSISPGSRSFSRRAARLRETYSKLLPGFSEEDIVGSPYAIGGYEVPQVLGGEVGLAQFRSDLHALGLKLILDFIPNHTGLDHPWVSISPELFVQSLVEAPGAFRQETSGGLRWIAHGKDPYFPPWADTAQLDYRNATTRARMLKELKSIAQRCDGVRCDMAMLVLNDVFVRNWSRFPRPAPERETRKEFWAEAISTIKTLEPNFLFLAEAYWGLEKRLLDLGFDFAYDKALTDHLIARRYAEAQRHVFSVGDPSLSKGVHFLENHDEPRVASLLSIEEHRAAAFLLLGLPGMTLLHEGQLSGAVVRASVHLRRRPPEIPQPDIARFYELLLATMQRSAVGRGAAELLGPAAAWNGNPTAENFIITQWQSGPGHFDLVVVNLAPHRSQCYVKPTVEGLEKQNWSMRDLLGTERHEKSGADMNRDGLYLDLAPHAAHLFQFQPSRGEC